MGASLQSRPATLSVEGQAPLPVVRETVRDLLLSSAAYHSLTPDQRREISQSMVSVCQTAVALLQEEVRSDALAGKPPGAQALAQSQAAPERRAPARAQNAGEEFSGVSAQRVAGTTHAILKAVSFPRFVTELINGVFKALVDSNQQQMQSYVELIRNVAASTDGFADMNMAPNRARQWLIDAFPGSFEMDGGEVEEGWESDEPEESRLRMRPGASMPPEAALRAGLGLAPEESVPSGDPETALVPFARRALARQRQQSLATMVMLGMQRIVVESGRLNASMRFHIDTRSAAAAEEGSRFDLENKAEASGKFGAGPWGVEAKMTNTIGYVSTQKTQTSEEMNTDLDLNSSVELYFKTDYLPLDRMAGAGQVDRIRVNTLNPDAEAKAALDAREKRVAGARTAEAGRSKELDSSLKREAPPQRTAAPPAGGGARPGATQNPPAQGTQNPPAQGTQNPPAQGTQNPPAQGTQNPPGTNAQSPPPEQRQATAPPRQP